MRTIYPIIAFLLSGTFLKTQTLPYWSWARNIVQGSQHTSLKISSDPYGNVFVLGQCDKGAQPAIMNDSGTYLARFDRYGHLSWSLKLKGTPKAMCASPAGEIYVGGTLQVFTLNSNTATTEAFLSKYDHKGNQIWDKKYIGPYASINALTVSPNGNVYVTGSALAGLQMDNHMKKSAQPFFIAKVDGNGNTTWIRSTEIIPDTSQIKNINNGYYITVDAHEKLYLEYNVVNCPNWSCDARYLLKLDQNGNYYFHKKYENYRGNICNLLVEPSGDIIMAHLTDVWTSGGAVTLLRWDSTMTTKKWELRVGGWQCQNLLQDVGPVPDLAGNVYMAGTVGEQCWWPSRDSITLGPKTLYTDSLSDLVLSKIDKLNGQVVDVIHIPGRLYDGITSIAADGLGNCMIAGFFNLYNSKDLSHQNDTLCFGSDCLVGSTANTPMFLAKLKINPNDHTDDVSVNELSVSLVTIAPNPSSGLFSLKGASGTKWQVYDLNGRIIASGCSSEMDLTKELPGIYIAVLKTGESFEHIKIVKQN